MTEVAMTQGRAGAEPRPKDALVEAYASRGDYVDCYAVDVRGAVAIDDLIEAFFNSRAFQAERWVLKAIGRRPLPAELAAPTTDARNSSTAWTVEARRADEILLCDFAGFTRCWLKVAPSPEDPAARSRLYFGTAFAKSEKANAANAALRALFVVLRPLHAAYAKALLNSAAARLTDGQQ